MTQPDVAELGKTLAQVLAQLTRLSGAPQRLLSRADAEALAALLPPLRARCGSYVFSVSELLAHAALPLHADLREAIEAATGKPLQSAGRTLGKLLARTAGATACGLRVDRVGDARDGALWVCVVVLPA